MYQGMYVGGEDGSLFMPCTDKASSWYLTSKDPEIVKPLIGLAGAAEKIWREQNLPLFIEFEGFTTSDKPNDAYDQTVWVTRLISFKPLDYNLSQCREDQKPATSSE